jgi:5-methylcytosine-specific restriction endonuclease McrA
VCNRAAARRWYENNKERVAANVLAWQEAHPEKVLVSKRKWYAKHPDASREQLNAWRKKNPEKARLQVQRRLSVLAGVVCTLTPEEWLDILEYFGHACAYCLRTDLSLTQEHVVPISRGGGTTAENIVPACGSCNSKKGHRWVFFMVGASSARSAA